MQNSLHSAKKLLDGYYKNMKTIDSKFNSTFSSIFCNDNIKKISVPDYQRAYSWEKDQIELFIGDIKKIRELNDYYFGHFIVHSSDGMHWELVDGQQRVTTVMLFFLACRIAFPDLKLNQSSPFIIIDKFRTVSYDSKFLVDLSELANSPSCKGLNDINSLKPETRSQMRICEAINLFLNYLNGKEMTLEMAKKIIDYIAESHCSHHVTSEKSLSINIFEMHNTRGIRLTTLETVKALLMRHVYDHADQSSRDEKISNIQGEFGDIYKFEDELKQSWLRGKIDLDKFLYLHLKAIDDGEKRSKEEFGNPAKNDSSSLITYIRHNLNKNGDASGALGVKYATSLSRQLRDSFRVAVEEFPKWDTQCDTFGDCLILNQDVSCQFYLMICRGDMSNRMLDTVRLWENFLYNWDFHELFYRLKSRDNFADLFSKIRGCNGNDEEIHNVISSYARHGFRMDKIKNGSLSDSVVKYAQIKEEKILKNSYTEWYSEKIKYAIYKYEKSQGATVREVIKAGISVEHIIPQNFGHLTDDMGLKKKIEMNVNGIGNLLIISHSENSSNNNKHPVDKSYGKNGCSGGYYSEHERLKETNGRDISKWLESIDDRGKRIYKFMVDDIVKSVTISADHKS